MKLNKFIIIFCLFLQPFIAVNGSETNSLTLPKIQILPIKDTQSNRQYELYIKLPEGYSKNTDKAYPVIYYTDAMWHVELLSAATEFLMEEAILVGISWQKDVSPESIKSRGEHFSRFRDYSISESSNPERQAKYQFGQASNHLSFIRNDVIKTIERRYRTLPENRSYFGYSLGGEFGAYILMAQPTTFKNYILGSPSLWHGIPNLVELRSKSVLKHKNLNANVFIAYGSQEEKLGGLIEEFIQILKATKDESLTLKHVVIEGSHQTAFPMTGVSGVTWLASLASKNVK